MKRILTVFSPHPDDETLACGGTLAKKIMEKHAVYVIFMTDGRNSHKTVFNIQENPTPEEVKVIRKNEAKEVAKILGVKLENLFFLDFEDGTLKDNIRKANAIVKKHLIKLNPTEIFIPNEYDMHKDHSLTNTIVWLNNDEKFQNILKNPNLIEMNISDVINLKNRAIDIYKSQVDILFPSQTKPILGDTFLSNFKKPVECFLKYRIQKAMR
ncbi:PIG-L family deacetylase [Dehalococcoidia bacterium]|nr:PIG-L family deacetylase [Dehalococcoidia bacterium]